MAARRKTSKRSTTRGGTNFFTKDLFIFIGIMAIVAIITYVLTYNAIMAKFNQQIGTTNIPYQLPPGK
jgi:hypothetical protein